MSTRFRLFFDCHSFDAGWQGTTTYLAGIINALPAAAQKIAPELDIEIICAATERESVDRHIKVPYDFQSISSGFISRSLVDIPIALRRCNADLSVSQYVRPFFSPCPTLSVVHDVLFLDFPESFSWRYRFLRRLLFRWSAENSTFVSTVSQYSASRIARHFKIDESEILIVANAVDTSFTQLEGHQTRRPIASPLRLLSVSRLERRKRHEWCISAMDALSSAGIPCELTIVGSGEGAYADELRQAVLAAGKEKGHRISLVSHLNSTDLLSTYQASDILLFPSEAEGFGIPVIEAAALGKPCVVSKGGALAEFDGLFSGIGFDPNSLTDFLQAVSVVARNIEAFSAEALDKRAGVARRFSWDVAAERYIEVFQRIHRMKL